jgi:hypothetical protein
MRDAAHYRRMMMENPDASVGVSLAAAAVYASRYGVCEASDRNDEYRDIVRSLKRAYGETLDAPTVLEAMDIGAATSLMGAGDIAQLAEVTVDAVHQWAKRHPEFRALAHETSAGLIWHRADVVAWLQRTGRTS